MGAAVLAVLCLVVGRWLGWVELATLGVTLVAVLAVALLLTVGRTRYAVRLDLADRRVRIGERAVGGLTVRNTARGRSLPALVELPVGEGRADFPVPSLASGAEHDELFAIPTAHRGVVVVGPVQSVRGTRWAWCVARCAGRDRWSCSCTRAWCRSWGPARVCCATWRVSRRATCPTRTCRSTRCATTCRATTVGRSTGGRRPGAAR
ncbi:hypothetical protein [Cellulomonas soli]